MVGYELILWGRSIKQAKQQNKITFLTGSILIRNGTKKCVLVPRGVKNLHARQLPGGGMYATDGCNFFSLLTRRRSNGTDVVIIY